MKKNRNNGGKSCWMIFSLGTIFSFLFESWKLIEKKSHWKCGCNVLLSFGFAKKSYQKLQKDPREIFWYDEAAAAGVNQKNGKIVENIFCYFVQKSPGGKKSWLAVVFEAQQVEMFLMKPVFSASNMFLRKRNSFSSFGKVLVWGQPFMNNTLTSSDTVTSQFST